VEGKMHLTYKYSTFKVTTCEYQYMIP